jgi:hypothetical protein
MYVTSPENTINLAAPFARQEIRTPGSQSSDEVSVLGRADSRRVLCPRLGSFYETRKPENERQRYRSHIRHDMSKYR